MRRASLASMGWAWKRQASSKVSSTRACGIPWFTITKKPTSWSARPSSAAVAAAAAGRPARYGPRSITGITMPEGSIGRGRWPCGNRPWRWRGIGTPGCALYSRRTQTMRGGVSMEIKAAVCRATHVPVGIESIDIDRPSSREVLVRTVATGVCHSDLHVVDGDSRYPLDRGIVLGHEGAGVVEAVGDQVTTLRPGDHVVACLSGFCGSCAQCLSGHPNVCVGGAVARGESAPPRLSKQGAGIPSFAGIGSYAERMLLHENSVVKIDDDLPLDRVALVGCGVLTGVGAALRSAGLEAGQTAAVFGCGGVGLSIVQGARIGGARTIIALDRFDGKLEMARRVGATHVVNTTHDDPVAAVRALTGGAGVDHTFEAVGNATLVRQAIESLAIRGTATIVGVLPPDAKIEFPWMAIRPECRVQTSRMGGNRFRIDIPRYLDFYRQGRLLLDEMVTRRGRLDDLNEAFRAMKAGEVARTVLTFD